MTQVDALLEVVKATLAFDENEDRISLSCALKNNEFVVLWLTARLARKLVPHLLQLVPQLPSALPEKSDQGQAGKDAAVGNHLSDKHTKAGQAGVTEKRIADTPVVAELGSTSWVVTAIDVTNGPMLVQIVFRDDRGHSPILLSLEHTQLASWLEGLRQCYFKAGWAMAGWEVPASAASQSSETQRLALH